MNNSAEVAGTSNRCASSGGLLGNDSWVFNGASTEQIGLTGVAYSYTTSGGTYQNSGVNDINNTGQVVGYCDRYASTGSSLGQDAWLFNGSSTVQIGLIGGAYSYATSGGTYQNSSIYAMNNAGQATGTSNRYSSTGVTLGQDAWLFNGTSTQQLGLTGSVYSYSTSGGIHQSSSVVAINDAGDVVGTSIRYGSGGTSLGQDGWYFDPTSDKTSLLQFSIDSAKGDASVTPQFLTSSGVVLGYYELYSGSTDEGQRAFYWTETAGFQDLASLVNGGLTAAGWQNLAQVEAVFGLGSDGSPLYIAGGGVPTGTAGQSGFLMTALVPEPAASILLATSAALGLLRRRREADQRQILR